MTNKQQPSVREEKRVRGADNRQRLVYAGYEVLSEKGFGGTARDRIERAVSFIEEAARHEPQLFRMRYEIFALGLRNPEFLPVMGEQLAHVKANIARILGEWFPE